MCGIVAVVGSLTDSDPDSVRAAVRQLSHRGPDGEKVLVVRNSVLGHRRLAIIDLTDAASQPMVDPQTGCAITYNGEIYNYLEVRNELESLGRSFRTASDTEVLLQAYLQWDSKMYDRLNGMWAFAVWDPRKDALVVSRDRFGVKPLYWHCNGRIAAFASEPKAIMSMLPMTRRANERAIARFIAYSDLYTGTDTFYEPISCLPAGTFAEVQASRPSVVAARYWNLKPVTPLRAEDRTEELSHLISDATRLRMRSDVPTGLALSGGVDSSLLLACVSKLNSTNLKCFTSVYGADATGEYEWAALAAARANAALFPVEATEGEWLHTLEKIVWHMDGPGYSPAVYPAYRLYQYARSRGVPVLLEGQGADELFAGYPHYIMSKLRALVRKGRLISALSAIRHFAPVFGFKTIALWLARESFPSAYELYRAAHGNVHLLQPHMKKLARDGEANAARRPVALSEQLYSDFSSKILPGLLHYGDAVSMACGVETRLPFMDYRIVSLAFSLPDKEKLQRGETKAVLRQLLRQTGLPEIADRKDKQGYPTPVGKWLAEGEAGPISKLLLASDSHILQFCNRISIERLIRRHQRAPGNTNTIALYKILTTEIWLRTCL